MKLALLQCDIIDGDLSGNVRKLKRFCEKAGSVDLCVAAAEALAGPTGFYLWPEAEKELAELAAGLPAPLLIALPGPGNILITNGTWQQVGDIFDFCGKRIAINEANWGDLPIDLALTTAARPFVPHIQADWELILSGVSRQSGALAVSVNLVGGYGSVIYNGQSIAINQTGTLVARAKAFSEDILIVECGKEGRIEPDYTGLEAQWRALTLGVADFVHKAGAKKVLIGLSGGMDSALVASIAVNALGADNVVGMLMPSPFTSPESLRDAEQLAENLAIETFTVPITKILTTFEQELAPVFGRIEPVRGDLTKENLQARIRGVLLMAVANKSGALVLSTGNKSELAMGYCTLYGDTAGALAVIGDLFKTEVYRLARWHCAQAGKQIIPQNIFEKAPSAELRPDQKDTDSLPPYEELDPKLTLILRHGPRESEKDLARRVRFFDFKRSQSPPCLLVSGLPLSRLEECHVQRWTDHC